MRYIVHVLGCKANQYEAGVLREMLAERNLSPAGEEEPDLVIVHTCAVTAEAVRKSRRALCQARRKHPRARLIVSGCMAAARFQPELPPADGIVPAGPLWHPRATEILDRLLPDHPPQTSSPSSGTHTAEFPGRTRAILKIQDGCRMRCSYCIVPHLRGGPRDRSPEEVIAEARRMVERGYREIVVSGICVGDYGSGGAGTDLAGLLERLLRETRLERLRLSSLHPAEITPRLLAVWGSTRRFMPHVHLPLQSGSDRILTAMRRGYSTADYLHAVARARTALDDPSFTTDIIVGFPGETDEDFAATLDLCRHVGFTRMHVFPFSPRPGTAAARLPRQLPPETIRERTRVLRELARELARTRIAGLQGRRVEVLVETFSPDRSLCRGHDQRYIEVTFPGDAALAGAIVPVILAGTTRHGASARCA